MNTSDSARQQYFSCAPLGERTDIMSKNCLIKDGKKRYIIIDPKDLMEPLRDNKKIDKDYSPLLDYLEERYWSD